MDTQTLDLVVIGAGVIGLALTREAALRGVSVLCLEREAQPGTITSSRNSEVIHAGIYYAPQSLKARLCIEGRRSLVQFLETRGLPMAQPGKLIVATNESEEAQLDIIAAKARANGLEGSEALQPLSAAQVLALEPELACRAALLSPATGIFDAHAYMLALQGEAEANGAMVVCASDVTRVEPGAPHAVRGHSRGELFDLRARRVIIAAGHDSANLLAGAGLGEVVEAFAPYWLKGSYMVLNRKGPFRHLIYPVPSGGGLGVHVTLDMAGGTRFGPDTEPVETLDFTVNPARIPAFETAIRRYWPGLPGGALMPGYSGIRPKLRGPGGSEADFQLLDPGATRWPGLGALLGIESPGLTASLALGCEMCDRMGL